METENLRIIPVNIEDEMKSSYIDYSMSVIVGRALPDVRDGLKPVHRRVLYAMSQLSLSASSPYKKSANTVGEVLGKYHPHGDSAIYDTMVRLAQDFSMRYPLIDGQGNFGSIDGDSAAAMRYTEARMTRLAEEMLRDLNKNTVEFQDNFDGSLQEPVVLPAAFPNLLVNGSDGIAVGMATKIPPHNLGEVIDGILAFIDDREITLDKLIEHIPAPDFPTGGVIYGYSGVKLAYKTGRGRIVMRAKIEEEEIRSGRFALIIKEIPYQVNKSYLIEKIASLVRDKKIEGISDLRDESDRDGMRIVVELRKDAMPLVIQNQLYKFTQCQQTFGVNFVALVNGRPKTLSLKEAIEHYVDHRHEIVVRRTEFDLQKAEERAHILEGLKIALDHLDEVITIIRNSPNTDEAKDNLMAGAFPSKLTKKQLEKLGLPTHGKPLFSLTEAQAKAILEMRLSRLTGLERQKIEDEFDEVTKTIARLKEILGDEGIRMSIIRDELAEIKEKYGDPRRTAIDFQGGGEIIVEDLVEDDQMVVTVSRQGLIKRTDVAEYRKQGRGGRGVKGSGKRDEDYIEHLFVSRNHDYLLFFSDKGRCYWLRVFEIPEGTRTAKGRSVRNLIQIGPNDAIRAVLAVTKEDFRDAEFLNSHHVLMGTRKGQVKKTKLAAFSRPRVDGIIAISIVDDDQLLEAHLTDGNADVMLASSGGLAIRFHEKDVRATGRNTQGVRGIALRDGEQAVGMIVVTDDKRDVLTISNNGYGKRTRLDDYRRQSRGGQGVIALKSNAKVGDLVAIKSVLPIHDLMIVTINGILIRLHVGDISRMGRNTQGVRLIKLKEGDKIADVTRFVVDDDNVSTNGEAKQES